MLLDNIWGSRQCTNYESISLLIGLQNAFKFVFTVIFNSKILKQRFNFVEEKDIISTKFVVSGILNMLFYFFFVTTM